MYYFIETILITNEVLLMGAGVGGGVGGYFRQTGLRPDVVEL